MLDHISPDKNESKNKSYRRILKSTSIIGGSSLITIFFRIIRTKVLALLLGPYGIGLIGIYESITSLASSIAGMGIGSSGVRQIAESNGTGDNEKISKTILCLRRIALFSGLSGLLLLFFLSGPVCRLTFGNSAHACDLAILSVVIFLAPYPADRLPSSRVA